METSEGKSFEGEEGRVVHSATVALHGLSFGPPNVELLPLGRDHAGFHIDVVSFPDVVWQPLAQVAPADHIFHREALAI